MMTIAALVFVALSLIAALFQFVVALGAPWGQLTMGGRWPGRLPVPLRVVAVVQGGMLVFIARIVAGAGGLLAPIGPDWLLWLGVGVTLLSALMNGVTPSRPERLLWGPVTLIMAIAILWVATQG